MAEIRELERLADEEAIRIPYWERMGMPVPGRDDEIENLNVEREPINNKKQEVPNGS